MDRRELLGVLGTGAAGLIVASGREARAQHPHHHDKLHGECLKACEACATVCNETFHHCFHGSRTATPTTTRPPSLAIDCQEFCGLASELMARESPMISIVCLACADACKVCAAECCQARRPADEGVPRSVQEMRGPVPRDGQGLGRPREESAKAKSEPSTCV